MLSAALRAQVENLTEEISRQELLLGEMEARLKDLRAQLDSIPYPVLTLPVEITSMIFVNCVPQWSYWDISLQNPERPALRLIQVCRAWREIAIATSELWSRFRTELDENPSYYCSESFTRILNRARGCTLDVNLHTATLPDEGFGEHVKTLDQYCRRIRCLDLDMSLETIQKLGGYALGFPALDRLKICYEEDLDLDEEVAQLDYHIGVFKNSPCLRAVELRIFMNAWETQLSAFDLPWQQLTHFEGGQFYPGDCLKALDWMPNLTHCDLEVFGTSDSDELPHSHHPNIQHLRIIGYDEPRIFEHLTLPNLRTLTFTTSKKLDPGAFNAFLERSAPPLQKLFIENREGGTTLDFSRQLTALAITELEIFEPTEELVLEFFSAFSVDATFFSQLEHLSFRDCREATMENGEADVLYIMRNAGEAIFRAQAIRRTLRSLRVASAFDFDQKAYMPKIFKFLEADIRVYRDLKQSGMKIHIGTWNESFV